ncbi:hypothetical protein X275_05935 [Marinitoga sp. 1197]|uniref:DUF5320 domain-containing protein n=1 Tax=unclassified Marinitoga TaxID=2640159 RepID=UPI000641339C|nr:MULTISPECIES: DUF5320 domain-containing protein [unclassified Marinitoga]KLO21441.1 hypothetical protein X274_10670 [Marinitoga sp. 1155]KLO22514.1 hypothetical protein X275_05935 [Marinitoga sp. 1197]NUV00501.1 hypothetical protein [Marinitoga sp. 1154]
MPGFDGTGPMGTGPVGRRLGPCANPGYIAPVSPVYRWVRPFNNAFYGFRRGFGMGRGFGRGFAAGYGRGFGRGHGRNWW